MSDDFPLTDAELIKRAIEGVRPTKREGQLTRRALVGGVFSVGSGSSAKLCRRFGLDPFEVIEPFDYGDDDD